MSDNDLISSSDSDSDKGKNARCENTSNPLFEYLRRTMPEDGGRSMALYGASRSGKSCLLAGIAKEVLDEDYTEGKSFRKPINLMMTTSPHAEPLKDLGDDTLVFGEGYSSKFLKWARSQNKKFKNRYRFSLLFDDVTNTRHKKDLTQLILTDRNKGINSAISTQYVKLLPPDIRTNVNVVFLLKFFQSEGLMQATDLYLKAVLPRSYHMGKGKQQAYDFYEWWTMPGKGTGFLVSFLDNEGFAIDSDRRIFKIDKVRKLFEQGLSWQEAHNQLLRGKDGQESDEQDVGEETDEDDGVGASSRKRRRSPDSSSSQAFKKPRKTHRR